MLGGLGDDEITADSTDGAQTIDGGDGNDTIVHYYRAFASTITTGSGSDTIELALCEPGGGGDHRHRLHDRFRRRHVPAVGRRRGSADPALGLGRQLQSVRFGASSGFSKSGADTVLQWDQDGTAGGANWETLVVFQNTIAGDFTDANFVPGYDPDGSVPAGETINGTAGDDFLEGTAGGDTINALAGADFAFGMAGADFIYGGDGVDNLVWQ